jgi:predicted metalloendopeptidase
VPDVPGSLAAKPENGTWGVDLADMDPTVRPGEDFFEYSVGSWLETAEIPADDMYTGVDRDVNTQIHTDLDSLVQRAATAGAPVGDNLRRSATSTRRS